MQIKVNKVEEFTVTPNRFEKEEKSPKFIFKTPNSSDMLKFLWTNDINHILFDCFKEFENKIELIDEDGKEIKYNNYREFIEVGLSGEIASIHSDCVIEMSNRLTEMSKKAEKTEKKSKQPLKSGEKAN